ncbi:MAG: peptide transporter [Elusimicrobiaceae bacterium]|jgi:uncharacterized oligopeptide transporter (OPT) family protein|nr:peptide transporter [Elusimicrobiaceae bacterium]MBT3955492.1 peptide transporter [Elusimicrobiaceae bacterium]MBT4008552.1 peptide transporter [Elusimicrobiaceae bacterium]MBT4402375.1 peptide transporter [Elusimicrobiaceae bacterium]MBT4440055.1 peptide transporter [Elusimicrobiaceae bacterium]
MNEEKIIYAQNFKEQFTVRAILVGVLGSIIVSASSVYIALRLGALPWATIFAGIFCFVILKLLRQTNINEINVSQTAVSAGAITAGGVAFTVPAIWIMGIDTNISYLIIFANILFAVLLGVIFTMLIRRFFIEKQTLTFPIGIASASTLRSAYRKGAGFIYLLAAFIFSGLFTVLRDGFGIVPPIIHFNNLYSKNIFCDIWLSPMAIGMGYIIGAFNGLMWFGAGIITYFMLIPWLMKICFLGGEIDAVLEFKNNLAIGFIVGGGLAVVIKNIFRSRSIRNLFTLEKAKTFRYLLVMILTVSALLAIINQISILALLFVVVGVWLSSYLAAFLTGQTGIDPMEIFGILVLLAVKIFFHIDLFYSIILVSVVAVSCGIAGDIMQDFKAGKILKTNPKAQIYAELIGGLVGGIVAVLMVILIIKAYGSNSLGPESYFVATQSFAVSKMLGGLIHMDAFLMGVVVSSILGLAGLPSMLMGLGIYLPMALNFAVGIGALWSFLINKYRKRFARKSIVISSGLLGGESFVGIGFAIIKFITRS